MNAHNIHSQALGNVRVLDLTRVLAGPWCTQTLADMGADVIKIEHPSRGDDTRHWGPPYFRTTDGREARDATYFASTNRNKRSVGVDIAISEGADLVRALAAHCDVFIENFKVGDLKRYGLDYERIRSINPRIVYCSITGYGQSGPYSNRPGYDFVFQAEGGLMSITGERDDLPGGGPQKVGVAIADLTTGLYASIAILAALNHRHASGEGQYIDLALLDCVTALASNQGAFHLINDMDPQRWGNAHPALVPYQVLDTSDGKIVVAVGNDEQWRRFCQVLDSKELEEDPAFAHMSGRIQNRQLLLSRVQAIIATQSCDHWLAEFSLRDVPNGRINSYRETFQHPQIIHREMAVNVGSDNGEGYVRGIANPIKFSATPVQYTRAPSALGSYTAEVLQQVLGLGEGRIAALQALGVISTMSADIEKGTS
ncbi:CoA transferase [Comamonas thiooxydans]|uniref:CaiB/BaiF CoA transferase family protein n=1 Tax=Comamonas thiooxydans TaxID=363952 RepID=UPI000A2D1C32|nr:CaiB/BaiF CoA-transferase family protein [Comamonas thiooxydans]BDR11757.1 CoA transferase [Comamonas thiooxydans]